jgi:hypothetical protein
MVTEAEGYETIRKALGALLKETEAKRDEQKVQKEYAIAEQRNMIIHHQTEITRHETEMVRLEEEITQKSQPFDEKIASLEKEVAGILDTAKQIAAALNERGKKDIAAKITEVPKSQHYNPETQDNPHEPEPIKTAVKSTEKHRPIGSRNKKLPGKTILDAVEETLNEGRWETRQTIGKKLTKLGYPSKHTDLYASKALNTLKFQEKAVSYSKGKRVFWRSVKFPNLPIPKE